MRKKKGSESSWWSVFKRVVPFKSIDILISPHVVLGPFSSRCCPRHHPLSCLTQLKCHIKLGHQEVHGVPLFGLKGLGDDACGLPVLAAPQGNPVYLQDHLTHLQLAAVMSRTTPLREKKTERVRFLFKKRLF